MKYIHEERYEQIVDWMRRRQEATAARKALLQSAEFRSQNLAGKLALLRPIDGEIADLSRCLAAELEQEEGRGR